MVPNGQGGFRQESYSLRKDVGGGGSTGPSYNYARFGVEAWRFERKVARNRRRRDLMFPPTTVLDDLDSYFMDWQDD